MPWGNREEGASACLKPPPAALVRLQTSYRREGTESVGVSSSESSFRSEAAAEAALLLSSIKKKKLAARLWGHSDGEEAWCPQTSQDNGVLEVNPPIMGSLIQCLHFLEVV